MKVTSSDVLRKKTSWEKKTNMLFEDHLLGHCVYKVWRELEWSETMRSEGPRMAANVVFCKPW